ncbi:hypothetical protein [Spirosoma validum]|uniref:Uncharacterized protein n=1 Tax=Spirosoma validum TaxID=2771355 RepID=A0A927B083_9BACT|nr:hypothetical protein [Spirosoma validum]MBD2752892.1 hypothetical protein [Spirosoma validum]
MIAVYRQPYPDLNLLLTWCSIASFLWIGLLAEFGRITSRIELNTNDFIIKKTGHNERHYLYSDILAYNERDNFSRAESFNELTVYLKGNWFFIRSNEFKEYNYLKEQFTHYGQPIPYRKVLSLAERNRFRWLIGGLALLISVNIAFGYIAHNPVTSNPARLTTFTAIVDRVSEDRPKGFLKGVVISLRTYPALSFYISRRNFNTRLDGLKSTIAPNYPITLLIRESDYRKKVAKTEPLTFGDKYSDYKQILVFGVNQADSVQLQATMPVQESTRTNPTLRTILLGFLLLFCWTGWAYIDRHQILRAE